MNKGSKFLFAFAVLVLIPVELRCVESSLETQGEVLQGLLTFATGLNLVPIGLFWWHPRVALAVLLFLFFAIVPYQVTLLNRLVRINNEVVRIVDSRLRLRAAGIHLPATLDDYVFKDASVRKNIHRYEVSNDFRDFALSYFVVQPGITHWYDSKSGWDYYPD